MYTDTRHDALASDSVVVPGSGTHQDPTMTGLHVPVVITTLFRVLWTFIFQGYSPETPTHHVLPINPPGESAACCTPSRRLSTSCTAESG